MTSGCCQLSLAADRHAVEAELAQHLVEARALGVDPRAVLLGPARPRSRKVSPPRPSSSRSSRATRPRAGSSSLERVLDADRDEVVARGATLSACSKARAASAESLGDGVDEVADEDGDGVALAEARQVLEAERRGWPGLCGWCVSTCCTTASSVLAIAARRDEHLDGVGEADQADPVSCCRSPKANVAARRATS